ncbi:MAG TPA: reverse transcriptase domain-containing protein, partial [Nitrososphaeraceae archaeon]|nr:reverse transcriptase domain-containing protein [Nitrososphaeraceae archaeon]
RIPDSWGNGLTVLLQKKGPTDSPENFRPITLQPVAYKILSSILKTRITKFLTSNRLVDESIQKGFWPKSNGVTDHTSILSHIIHDAKRHHRSVVITLLDLKNAFGEISHKLIKKSLQYHNIPPAVIDLISNIYNCANICISVNGELTNSIKVGRGVLQGDPCSPLLFNICFNTLIRVIKQDKYKSLGFAWGPSLDTSITSWLQFADDAALIAHDCKSAQALVDIAAVWCKWAGMIIRIDKCLSFGMLKSKGNYSQFEPSIFIDSQKIPPASLDGSFKYLGKIFSFSMDNNEIKTALQNKISSILQTTSLLQISVQMKLKIVRLFIPSQINFELRMYDLPSAWISNNIDNLITNAVRDWLQFPISSCLSEIMSLPLSKGGLAIPSIRSLAEKHSLSVRFSLKHNVDNDIRLLFTETSVNNINVDARLKNNDLSTAKRELDLESVNNAFGHVSLLQVQGLLISSIITHLKKSEITRWSKTVLKLPESLFKFARRALQQQLATATNLKRWGRRDSNSCTLCKAAIQTNKHVLSNCSAPSSLARYTSRHDNILIIIANWLLSVLPSSAQLYVDLNSGNFNKVNNIFKSLRPDISVLTNDKIFTLELTVCHESNFSAAHLRKISRYKNLKEDLVSIYLNHVLIQSTVEVSVLGFVSDTSQFTKLVGISPIPICILNNLTNTAIDCSKNIFIHRDSDDTY